jgi:hypothetical protein
MRFNMFGRAPTAGGIRNLRRERRPKAMFPLVRRLPASLPDTHMPAAILPTNS